MLELIPAGAVEDSKSDFVGGEAVQKVVPQSERRERT